MLEVTGTAANSSWLHTYREFVRVESAKVRQNLSAEQDGQQHAQSQRKQPDSRSRSANRAYSTLFPDGASRIEKQPSGVAALEEQKYKGCDGSVNQVSGEQWKQG